MALLTGPQTKKLFRHAAENRYGMVALNADSQEMIRMALMAAKGLGAPIIIEYSIWQARSFPFGGGLDEFKAGMKALKFENGELNEGMARFFNDVYFLAESPQFKDVPVVLHVDHFPDERGPIAAIKGEPRKDYKVYDWAGGKPVVSSVSFDAKGYTNLSDIIRITLEIAKEAAYAGGVAVEAEPTEIGSKLTTLDETTQIAEALVKEHLTVDSYAPNLGSVHGQTTTAGSPVQLDKAYKHREIMTNALGLSYPMGLAFHGTSGFNDSQLKEAVQVGGIKFNTCTTALGEFARAAADYYWEVRHEIVEGHKDMKQAATYGASQTHITQKFVPWLQQRIDILGGKGKAPAALEYCLK
ncbi:class II fructose-bisphosphate aldolase [Candidatus Woesearchaeota archaeon]|nr:class II fructose-bisphosphate aldolase [Candidatus Woesearchaeota archaeon]